MLKATFPCLHSQISQNIEKYKINTYIQCSQCQQLLSIVPCPYFNCGAIMWKKKPYKMGQATQCIQCKRTFRQVVCKCGNIINDTNGSRFCQGLTKFNCQQCFQVYTILTCIQCYHCEYFNQSLVIGKKYSCTKCHKQNIYLVCPSCDERKHTNQFILGKSYDCVNNNCKKKFQFVNCPHCLCLNYEINQIKNLKKICKNDTCRKSFSHISCKNCKQSLYIQSTTISQFQQSCVKCKQKIVFFNCLCDTLSIDIQICPKCKYNLKNLPRLKNGFTQKSQLNKPQNKSVPESNNQDKKCKSCFQNDVSFINIVCGHLVLCQNCYVLIDKNVQLRQKCIVCKTKGQFKKVFY